MEIDRMQTITRDFINMYTLRISKIEEIMSNTYNTLDDCREKRKTHWDRLKDSLAHEKSLRKKDFDLILSDLQIDQNECEKNMKLTLRLFADEHKNLASIFLESLATGKLEQSHETIARLEKNGDAIQKSIISFQRDQEEMTISLKSLLENSEQMRIKDFKKMIEAIRARQMQRSNEIKSMLTEISREHTEMRAMWIELHDTKITMQKSNYDIAQEAIN